MCLSTPPGMVLRRAHRIVSDLPRLSLRFCASGLPVIYFTSCSTRSAFTLAIVWSTSLESES